MGLLLFKKQFFESIRAGRKRTTIRRWDRPRLCAGQRAYSPGLGWMAIEQIERIMLRDLDDADAEADGFPSALQMRRELRKIYPECKSDRKHWFRVRFRINAGSQ